MITAFAATINGGNLVQPYVVQTVSDPRTARWWRTRSPPWCARWSARRPASGCQRDPGAAWCPKGTGKNAYVAGYRIGGKTGSSETPEAGRTIVSFMGFAPADDPQVIVLLAYDNPRRPRTAAASTTGV